MHKELNSIHMIREYMVKKGLLQVTTSNIDTIFNFFQYLANEDSKKKFNSLYILNYIHSFIASEEVAKRKTSARVFEDLLAIIFNGIVTDSKHRKNLEHVVPDYFTLTKDKIASNKREKIDLLFEKEYGVSVKTLMHDNHELNMGSFERQVLFDGFGVSDYLKERKAEKDGIGLGSRPQLKALLEKIDEKKHYHVFQERLVNMYNFIFSDDMILAIKESTQLRLYFFTGEEFTTLISKRAAKIDSLLEVINRWEGNSIRIDREILIANAKRQVVLDLEFLNETIIQSINDFDTKLHGSYIKYFNETNNSTIQKDIIDTLETLFENFDSKYQELK